MVAGSKQTSVSCIGPRLVVYVDQVSVNIVLVSDTSLKQFVHRIWSAFAYIIMSAYFANLFQTTSDVAERYKKKLRIIGYVDPYCLKERDLSHSPVGFPPVGSMDITCYLVLGTSFYTHQQMKAYKSLHAYKYFEAGFVTADIAVVVNVSFYSFMFYSFMFYSI